MATVAVFVSNFSVFATVVLPLGSGIGMNDGVSYINQFFKVRDWHRTVAQRLIQNSELTTRPGVYFSQA